MTKLDQKLDSRAQIQLATGELANDLEVMLRLDKDLTEQQQQCLELAGCKVKSARGNVVVGESRLAALEHIAEQEFVQRIEVSRALHPEDSGSNPKTDEH